MNKVAIITGASSGIGKATAEALAGRGYTVYDFSRTGSHGEKMEHIFCDVSNEETVKKAVAEVIARENRIDILINNAGFGISGAVEFTEKEDAKHLLDVNLLGADCVTKHVLPHMRKRGEGRIINTSSVAAVFPIPYQTWYSVSKAAVNAYTLALRNEVSQFGVSVSAVMPGDIQTGFTEKREKNHSGDEVYSGRISKSVQKMEKDEKGGMQSEKAGNFIASKACKRHVKPLYVIGNIYRVFAFLNRLLPTELINRIIGKMYGGY